ncbi:MAG: DUF4491 family protein [Prevotellaceae bacterium]|jgi:hypothetical protein|nr:DUF4491 family protein [Prevotellaceae bacterium]
MYYFTGLIVGFLVFLIIGLFHPLVVKAEYYLGKKSKWIFAVAFIISATASLLVSNLWSIFLGCFGFSCFWSVFEIDKQQQRRRERNGI